nr:protein PHR1-LIKE 3-like isoform X1 [Ipomoea batatas]
MSSSVNQQEQDNNADKTKLKWTYILHYTFMDAVKDLGGNIWSVTASEIRSRMNMPGLTEEHVRSHLQKIRNLYEKGPDRMNTKAKIHLIYLLATPGGASARTNWSRFLSACEKWLSPEDIKILVLDVTEDFLMSDNDNIIGQVNQLDEEKLNMIIAEFASLI